MIEIITRAARRAGLLGVGLVGVGLQGVGLVGVGLVGVGLVGMIACDDGGSGDATRDANAGATDGATLPDGGAPDSALPDSTLPDSTLPDSTLPDATLPDAAGPVVRCAALAEVACQDQMIQELQLQDVVAPGLIENTAEGDGWVSAIDATAGGFEPPMPQGYVYGRFTDTGLERVALDDEAALESGDWDIAFRRYVIRVNGGASGPSCVSVARTPPGTDFGAALAPAEDALYRVDSQYGPDCDFVGDGSGLPTSPATALSSYYAYSGCVEMTGNVYVLRLADGRDVKLTVTGYYAPADRQQFCEDNGQAPMPSGSGNIGLRWAFLDAGE